jgi:flagellar biosynthesis chaperone FliJ
MSDTSTTDAGAFSSEFLKSEGELLAYVAQLRTMANEQPETFEAMQERGARYVASLRREADRVEAFLTDLRAKIDKHEHTEAAS